MNRNPSDLRTGEDAVFLLIRALQKGAPMQGIELQIFRILEGLLQKRTLSHDEFYVLRLWGERGYPPPPAQFGHLKIWRGAMREIEKQLRKREIIW